MTSVYLLNLKKPALVFVVDLHGLDPY